MIGELFEPLTKAQASRLRESILTEGVRDPVLVSPSGRVLSGANRKRIADELGLPYEERVVKCADDTDELIIMIEHNPQRRLSNAARDEAIAMLVARGWSKRRIADMLGVSDMTVGRAGPGASDVAPGPTRPTVMSLTPSMSAMRRLEDRKSTRLNSSHTS